MYHNSICQKCRLWEDVIHPCVLGRGDPSAKLLIIGEALGCITGDSLVETAYRDKSIYPQGIPIKDLVGKTDFYVYSFDIESQKLVLGKILKVWKTGTKKVYKVTYEWSYNHIDIKRNSLTVTSNHPFLLKKCNLKDPYKGRNDNLNSEYLSIDTGLSVGHSLQPFYRRIEEGYSYIGTSHTNITREAILLLQSKLERLLKKDEQCHHIDRVKLNDSYKNLELLNIREHGRVHSKDGRIKLKDPLIKQKHLDSIRSEQYRTKQSIIMKEILKDPFQHAKRLKQIEDTNESRSNTVINLHKDPVFCYKQLMGRARSSKFTLTEGEAIRRFKEKFPNEEVPLKDNHKVVSIEYVGEEDVYDIEVEKYHNFAVNGIFVHNSEEDQQGLPFVGSSGQKLQSILDQYTVKYYISNAVKCRPTTTVEKRGKFVKENRTPTSREIKLCSAKTFQLIDQMKPDVILTLGAIPVNQLMNLGLSMEATRGRIYYHPQLESYIVPTWHPAYIGYSHDRLVERQFRNDLEQAINLLRTPKTRRVCATPKSLSDPVDIKTYLEHLNTQEECAVDLETTGLNPRSDRITDISFCCQVGQGVHIKWNDMLPFYDLLKEVIQNPKLKLIMQNGKFDSAFFRAIGVNPVGFFFDTQNAYHTLTMTFEGQGKTLYSLEIMSWLHTKEGNYKAILEEFGGIVGHQTGATVKKQEKKEIKEKKPKKKEEPIKQVVREPLVESNALFDFNEIQESQERSSAATEYFSHIIDEEDTEGILTKFAPVKRVKRIALGDDNKEEFINKEQETTLLPYVTWISDKLKKKVEDLKLTPLQFYSAMDADVTLQIYYKLKPQIDEEFKEVFYDLIMPLTKTLLRLEENGFRVDVPYIDTLLEQNTARSLEIKEKFFKKLGYEFNIASTKELREVIYNKLKVPPHKDYMTKGGKGGHTKLPSTDKYAIEFLARKHPVLKGIVEYRELEKENSTYLQGFKDCIDLATGRIHPSFMQHTAATGRLSASDPNCQNIKKDNRIRNMIIPREGWKFVTADLSQAELRIIAMMANDWRMLQAFASGYDFHTYTVYNIFGIHPDKFDKTNPDHMKKRGVAKNINFGVIYQIGYMSLANDLDISQDDAKKFINTFYTSYPDVKRWIDSTQAFASKYGYVKTLHGRKRYLPYVFSSDIGDREGALRQAVNTPIQGTASDCACFGLIATQKYIDENHLRTEPIMIIHDEIVLESPPEEWDLMLEKLPYFMTHNIPKVTIPLVADAELLDRWKK